MKKDKIIYWSTTGVFSAFSILTAVAYFTDPRMPGIFKHLGFPDYFRTELGIAKLLGAIALILPGIPDRMKEWAYAGFGIVLVSGVIAHLYAGDPAVRVLNAVIFLVILAISYSYRNKMNRGNHPPVTT